MTKQNQKRAVTILCQHFYPEESSTGQLATELAEDLASYQYRVTAITSQPTYFLRSKEPAAASEDYKKIIILRTANSRFNKDRISGRILNSLSYAFLALGKLFTDSARGVVLVYTNPPFLPLVAFLNKIIRKQPYIVIVYYIYPEAAFNIGCCRYLKPLTKILNLINIIIFNSAEKVVTIGSCLVEVLKRKGVKPRKIVNIPNWADGKLIRPLAKKDNSFLAEHKIETKFIVEYSGTLARYHDFEIIISAAEKLSDQPILFVIISSGARLEDFKNRVSQKQLKNFKFIPYQEKKNLKYSFPAADIGLVLQRDDYKGINLPSKLYSYLAAGISLIGVVPDGSEVARLIEDNQCGFVVAGNDSSLLAEKIKLIFENEQLREQMAKRARDIFQEKFERGIVTKQYKQLIDKLY